MQGGTADSFHDFYSSLTECIGYILSGAFFYFHES